MADHEKTLSVIIPSYNEGKTICHILTRVLSVLLPFEIKKEIVVVDDGSADETGIIYPGTSGSSDKICRS